LLIEPEDDLGLWDVQKREVIERQLPKKTNATTESLRGKGARIGEGFTQRLDEDNEHQKDGNNAWSEKTYSRCHHAITRRPEGIERFILDSRRGLWRIGS